MILSNTTRQGSIAEAFVCYDMAKYGIRVAASPFENAPYDLIAEHNGGFVKVQVKSTAKIAKENSYVFNMGKSPLSKSDLIAYVALDKNIVCYRRPKNIKGASGKHWISQGTMLEIGNTDLFDIFGELRLEFG